jgi:hypothetical protein
MPQPDRAPAVGRLPVMREQRSVVSRHDGIDSNRIPPQQCGREMYRVENA